MFKYHCMWPYLEIECLLRESNYKMRLYGWALIQYGVLIKINLNTEHTHTQLENDAKVTQGEDSHVPE